MRSGLAGRVQVAIPMSMEPSCAPCESTQTRHHLYGGEIHGLIEGSALPNIRPGLDAGLFFPGAFFVDASSQSSDEVSDFPIGWQLFATVAIHFQKSER